MVHKLGLTCILIILVVCQLQTVECIKPPKTLKASEQEKENESRELEYQKLKEAFESILSKFSDKDAAHICVALSGKANFEEIKEKIKKQEVWSSLTPDKQNEVISDLKRFSSR